MPMPGDQHKDTRATTNPFLEQKPHLSEFTAAEIATLQSRLDKQLGPEYISTRPGAGGGKVHYLAAEKVINLANEVFGFNGWSSAIQNVQIDFVDENQGGKITLGLSTIVRVTLKDGTYHEDIGYGHIENCKGKAAAFEKAKKEAATDAMKRALRNFGNVLGNCLYDKDYLQKVTKVKCPPTRWDAENLHRHPDYAPVKKEAIADPKLQQNPNGASRRQSSNQSGGSAEYEDDFGGNFFEDTDFSHPDEVRLDETMNAMETPAKRAINGPQSNGSQSNGSQKQPIPRMQSMPQMRPPNIQAPPPIANPQQPQRPSEAPKPPNNADQTQTMRMPPPQAQQRAARSAAQQGQQNQHDGLGSRNQPANAERQGTHAPDQANAPELDELGFPVPRMPPPGAPEGFVTGRNAETFNQLLNARPPNEAIAFNPHAESPSIRRTQGVNPGKSAPITRQALNSGHVQPAGGGPGGQGAQPGAPNGMNGASTPVRANFVNPSADMNRRIGMPNAGPSHNGQNRGAYKPPTVNTLKRPPLTDVSNIHQLDGTGDVKKARTDQPVPDAQNEAPAQPPS